MPRVPVHFTFQPSTRLDCQLRVHLEISYHISQLRSISKTSQLTSMAHPEHIPIYHPSKFPSCAPSQTPFSTSIPSIPLPHTHTTTNFKHPPSLLPLAPPQLRLTHGLYQATLGNQTGHTALAFKAESHSRFQSRFQFQMQSCIQSCTGVKQGISTPNLHSLSLLFTVANYHQLDRRP